MYAAIFAAVLQGLQGFQKGSQESKQYMAQSSAKRWNAAYLRQEAEQAQAVSGAQEEQSRFMSRIARGERNALIGQSGTGFGGSNADMEHQSEVLAELDALNIRYAGNEASRRLRTQATLDDYFAKLDVGNAENAKEGAWMGLASGAVSGGSKYFYGRN